MAAVTDDWTVEQIGPADDKIRMELGEDGDAELVRLHRGGETVTFRVEDGVAEGVDEIPEWAMNVARRLGVEAVV